MIRSMTGFSHGDFSIPGIAGSIEIKSYNNRYLDLSISLPPWLSKLEPRIRSFLTSKVVHGKLEFSLRARSLEVPIRTNVDLVAAQSVAEGLRKIAKAAGVEEPLRLADLMAVEGVLVFEREIDADVVWHEVEPTIGNVFADFDRSRSKEGEALERDILANLSRVEVGHNSIVELLPEIEASLRRNVEGRFAEILGEASTEQRILSEVASLVMKSTINEEVVRLRAHLEAFVAIMQNQPAPAKKLDFLCQEMNREINTIGSKNIQIAVSEIVVELKDAVENIREQLRNIE